MITTLQINQECTSLKRIAQNLQPIDISMKKYIYAWEVRGKLMVAVDTYSYLHDLLKLPQAFFDVDIYEGLMMRFSGPLSTAGFKACYADARRYLDGQRFIHQNALVDIHSAFNLKVIREMHGLTTCH